MDKPTNGGQPNMARRPCQSTPNEKSSSMACPSAAFSDDVGDIGAVETSPSPENGLTSIPHRIHCPATTERVGGQDELDDLAVEHFLDTLAQVALAIASRKAAQAQQGGEVAS